jgi:hypothetical protein
MQKMPVLMRRSLFFALHQVAVMAPVLLEIVP